jgi:hypothetical protein
LELYQKWYESELYQKWYDWKNLARLRAIGRSSSLVSVFAFR